MGRWGYMMRGQDVITKMYVCMWCACACMCVCVCDHI